MSTRLDRLTSILNKISTRTATLKTSGEKTTTLESDIALATAAINSAEVAVADQAAKDYVVEFDSEATLKTDVATAIKAFIADIKLVHEKVVAAQKAVAKTYKGLGAFEKVTPSPTSATIE